MVAGVSAPLVCLFFMFITLMIFLLFLVPLETLKVPKMVTEMLCGVMWDLNSTSSFSNEQTRQAFISS